MEEMISEAESVLLSIKKQIGIESDVTEFDTEIIMAVNSCLGILNQLGVGVDGFSISNVEDKWADFIGEATNLEMVKNYIGLKVGLIFDPPQSTALIECKKNLISELEWRLNVTVDP